MPLRRLNQAPPRPGVYTPLGAMNRQVTLCSPGQANQSTGQIGPPKAAFSCWAALYAIAGDELDRAQQIAQRVTHLVVINYALNVQENMVIQYIDGGVTRTFQIAAVDDPDEMRVQLKVYCFEIGQNAGGSS